MSTESVELRLFLENDGELYRQQTWPIIQNIARKMKAGKYDHAKAPKLWGYLVESAAKKYAKEFSVGSDWHKIFSVATRKELAQELADDYRDKIRAGEYSIALGRKKNPASALKMKFRDLSIGDMFEFSSLEDFPFSGMARGPWIKKSARVYAAMDGRPHLQSVKVGSVNTGVTKIDPRTLGRKKNPTTRKPDQSDIEAAQRGLRMVAMSVADLDELIAWHKGNDLFASKVIVLAAKQMRAAKLQAGARRNNPVRPLKGAKRRAKPGAVSKLLAKARETFKALNPGKRVPPSLASKKKRRQKNPAARYGYVSVRAGAGHTFGQDAVTPATWKFTKAMPAYRHYGYSLPSKLSNSYAFKKWSAGLKRGEWYGSLVELKNLLRLMIDG